MSVGTRKFDHGQVKTGLQIERSVRTACVYDDRSGPVNQATA